ncbi:molecular chaperone Hsp33 [Tepidamorphus gemmatus]|uniref:Molecular chaperone Hsp33 n=2 Tax=Tepidamorphus gemmatus TaxID=747076 RepID=A0A4R3MIN2_9HYPH|nr:Hsp33 family molecular chaperone [Tepidamorphus gemmatus]TCT13204.1 molecular chaperone Hsp33 [Tepidamorphus gemmatus]
MASRPPAAAVLDAAADDFVLPFAVDGLDVRGRLVRLGPAIDTILARHGYPDSVCALIAEAAALTILLGSTLKTMGRFILQTQSDGPVRLMVVDLELPDRVRACASFDARRVEALERAGEAQAGNLLGAGSLAMTIDPGPPASRYQGIVPLTGGSLEDAAHLYFRQSEQIPTSVRLAAARAFRSSPDRDRGLHWRCGGIIVQHLPASGPARMADLPPGDAPEGAALDPQLEPDEWSEARLIAETVEDHELIDPSITAGQLLYRLYHERGVRVFDPQAIVERCRCSREGITAMLSTFPDADREHMVRDGMIEVTCEFCSTRYRIDPASLAG